MKRKIGLWQIQASLLLSLAILGGCSHSLSVSPTTNALTPSPTATASTPLPTPTATTIVPNTTTFTVPQADDILSGNLYGNCKSPEGTNVFFSPFSIITALAMAQEGAAGNTATQMQNVLNLNSNAAIRQQGFQQLINQINSASGNYTLDTADNLWIQQGFSILPSYINTVQTYYDAGVTNVNFVGNPSGAVSTIDGAVSQETAGFIPNLLTTSDISVQIRLVLTNAIYFQSDWQNQFVTTGADQTSQQLFYLTPSTTETVSMMHVTFPAVLGNFNGAASVLAIPYKNNGASMYVFLPTSGISSLESVMTGSNLNAWLAANAANLTATPMGINSPQVALSFPKFTFSTSYELSSILSQMGMPLPFSLQANFSGIDGQMDLSISKVIHQAYVSVSEVGTTAAAATGVVVGIFSVVSTPIATPFVVNQPFIFAIVDNTSNTVLFMGRVCAP
ncbi:MAG TPA: serpin family protein [bacterium]|nr:serpin family protein [bacterium]